jgi:hypothetical protein
MNKNLINSENQYNKYPNFLNIKKAIKNYWQILPQRQ